MKRRVSYLCTNGGLWHWLGWLWWGTTILPLACCNIKCVASSFQQSLMLKKKSWICSTNQVHLPFRDDMFLHFKPANQYSHVLTSLHVILEQRLHSYFDFGFIWSFIGFWHFGPLFLSLPVRLHHATKKGTFVLESEKKKKYCQCIHLCQHHQDNFLLCVHHKLNNLLHRTAGDKTVMFDNIMPMCADKLQMTTLDINCLNSHLNMWEVAVLELQKDLQSTFLVEFFQSLNRSIV